MAGGEEALSPFLGVVISTWMEGLETNGKSTLWSSLTISIMCAVSSIILERSLATFISVSRKNWSGSQTFILLPQPGKCRMGVSPLAEVMLSPQPGACLLLFTPSVAQNAWFKMQLSGLGLLNQKLHLHKIPWWPCAHYSVRSAGPEDREFPSLGHTCGTEM